MIRVQKSVLCLCAALIAVSGCRRDETVSAYGAADKVWRLVEMDGAAISYSASLRFPEPGQIAGDAPCNSYFGEMTVPYPWFEAREIAATQRACPELEAEQDYLTALSAMSLSEVLGDTLILSTPEGRKMVFKADG